MTFDPNRFYSRLYTDLAMRFGVNGAIIFNRLELISEKYKAQWVKFTPESWVRFFPFWDVDTVAQELNKLIAVGAIERMPDKYLFRVAYTGGNKSNTLEDITLKSLTLKNALGTHTGNDFDEAWDSWAFGAEAGEETQLSLLPLPPKKAKDLGRDPVTETHIRLLCRVCYGTETDDQYKVLTATERGKVANVVSQLLLAKADLGKIHFFEMWWNNNWRSKNKETGQRQFPLPNQVLTHWWEAMLVGKDIEATQTKVREPEVDIHAFMRNRAEKYKKHE